MKTTNLNTLFLFLVIRRIGQGCLALFRFTEADVLALLAPYGGCAFEVDRLQNNPPLLKKEARRKFVETSQPKGISESIPIGVHPDFTLVNRATASRRQLSRPAKLRTNRSAVRSLDICRSSGRRNHSLISKVLPVATPTQAGKPNATEHVAWQRWRAELPSGSTFPPRSASFGTS